MHKIFIIYQTKFLITTYTRKSQQMCKEQIKIKIPYKLVNF